MIWKGALAGMQLALYKETTTRLALFSKQSVMLVKAEPLTALFFLSAAVYL